MGIEACARAFGSSLALHAALGGSRIEQIDFVLADERKLAGFRETLTAVLSGHDLRIDDGLADAHPGRPGVSTDAPTCVAPITPITPIAEVG